MNISELVTNVTQLKSLNNKVFESSVTLLNELSEFIMLFNRSCAKISNFNVRMIDPLSEDITLVDLLSKNSEDINDNMMISFDGLWVIIKLCLTYHDGVQRLYNFSIPKSWFDLLSNSPSTANKHDYIYRIVYTVYNKIKLNLISELSELQKPEGISDLHALI